MTRAHLPNVLAAFLPMCLLGGCASGGLHRAGIAGGHFRHPLFNDTRAVRTAPPVGANRLARPRITRPSSASDRLVSFGHPLLNHGRPAPRPVRDTTPARVTSSSIERGLRVAALARRNLSAPRYRVGGRRFRKDCSGFVLSVLAQAGYDVAWLQVPGRGGGAAALFRALQRRGLVHRRKVPMVGDLVFFDNTYDRNRDGRANDELTHVGVVERVDPDGTVTFIHRVRRGPLRYRLNLFLPHRRRDARGKRLNHALRSGTGRRDSRPGLTGELFHAFATVPH